MKILCATISLVLGLYFFRNNIALSIVIALIYVIFIFIRFNKKTALVFFSLFIGGAVLGGINFEYNNVDNLYAGMVVEVKQNYFIFQSHYERFYVYEENTDKEFGDYLLISSKPSEYKVTTYESQFDFGAYLKNKGVKRSLNSNIVEWKFANPIRIHSKKVEFLSKFDEEASVLVNAIIFNEKDYSSPYIKYFDDLNLIYLISLSGIYLHSLFKATTYIFGLFTPKKVAQAVPIGLFAPLVFLSFPRISILRIFLMAILRLINEHFLKKRFSYLTLLSSLALFFLIIDFRLVYQESFYIGFLLSLLGVFYRTSINIFPKKYRKICSFIYAPIFLGPIVWKNKALLHPFQLIYQVILIPLIELFVLLILFSLLIKPSILIANPYAHFLVEISKSMLRFDITLPIMVNEWFFVVFYVSLILMLYFLESGRIRHLRNVSLVLVGFITLTLFPRFYLNSVSFINVGQGDSILIQNRNHTVLLDTGGNTSFDMAKETLIPYFHKIGVNHIDLLITSHDDYDHSGAASSLIENFKVYNYYKNRNDFPCKVGDIYLENINFYDGDENDSSLVFLINFMGKKWLFTGDASIASENAIINSGYNIDCDILKVGHHGSDTSSSEEFIKACSPSEAIISCGAKNKYGHPKKDVIDRLAKYNVKIRRTDVEGTISYVSLV